MTGNFGADLPTWITPSRTALLVVDMQVDFAAPDGLMGRSGADLSSVPAALAAAERLAAAARRAAVPIVFVGLQSRPGENSPAWAERVRRLNGTSDDGEALCTADAPGAAFVGPQPGPQDVVVAKARYSGFFATDLDDRLKTLGVDTVVVCGLTTECCVDSTVRDAFQRDYHVFLAGDACAAYEPDLHDGALKALSLNCAILVTANDVENAWAVQLNRQ